MGYVFLDQLGAAREKSSTTQRVLLLLLARNSYRERFRSLRGRMDSVHPLTEVLFYGDVEVESLQLCSTEAPRLILEGATSSSISTGRLSAPQLERAGPSHRLVASKESGQLTLSMRELFAVSDVLNLSDAVKDAVAKSVPTAEGKHRPIRRPRYENLLHGFCKMAGISCHLSPEGHQGYVRAGASSAEVVKGESKNRFQELKTFSRPFDLYRFVMKNLAIVPALREMALVGVASLNLREYIAREVVGNPRHDATLAEIMLRRGHARWHLTREFQGVQALASQHLPSSQKNGTTSQELVKDVSADEEVDETLLAPLEASRDLGDATSWLRNSLGRLPYAQVSDKVLEQWESMLDTLEQSVEQTGENISGQSLAKMAARRRRRGKGSAKGAGAQGGNGNAFVKTLMDRTHAGPSTWKKFESRAPQVALSRDDARLDVLETEFFDVLQRHLAPRLPRSLLAAMLDNLVKLENAVSANRTHIQTESLLTEGKSLIERVLEEEQKLLDGEEDVHGATTSGEAELQQVDRGGSHAKNDEGEDVLSSISTQEAATSGTSGGEEDVPEGVDVSKNVTASEQVDAASTSGVDTSRNRAAVETTTASSSEESPSTTSENHDTPSTSENHDTPSTSENKALSSREADEAFFEDSGEELRDYIPKLSRIVSLKDLVQDIVATAREDHSSDSTSKKASTEASETSSSTSASPSPEASETPGNPPSTSTQTTVEVTASQNTTKVVGEAKTTTTVEVTASQQTVVKTTSTTSSAVEVSAHEVAKETTSSTTVKEKQESTTESEATETASATTETTKTTRTVVQRQQSSSTTRSTTDTTTTRSATTSEVKHGAAPSEEKHTSSASQETASSSSTGVTQDVDENVVEEVAEPVQVVSAKATVAEPKGQRLSVSSPVAEAVGSYEDDAPYEEEKKVVDSTVDESTSSSTTPTTPSPSRPTTSSRARASSTVGGRSVEQVLGESLSSLESSIFGSGGIMAAKKTATDALSNAIFGKAGQEKLSSDETKDDALSGGRSGKETGVLSRSRADDLSRLDALLEDKLADSEISLTKSTTSADGAKSARSPTAASASSSSSSTPKTKKPKIKKTKAKKSTTTTTPAPAYPPEEIEDLGPEENFPEIIRVMNTMLTPDGRVKDWHQFFHAIKAYAANAMLTGGHDKIKSQVAEALAFLKKTGSIGGQVSEALTAMRTSMNEDDEDASDPEVARKRKTYETMQKENLLAVEHLQSIKDPEEQKRAVRKLNLHNINTMDKISGRETTAETKRLEEQSKMRDLHAKKKKEAEEQQKKEEAKGPKRAMFRPADDDDEDSDSDESLADVEMKLRKQLRDIFGMNPPGSKTAKEINKDTKDSTKTKKDTKTTKKSTSTKTTTKKTVKTSAKSTVSKDGKRKTTTTRSVTKTVQEDDSNSDL
ncbi:unnamed protein product [Amoebophrya sp. A25]|nr:unnamed protein product [Amoebophrya sp. A25]|eukprot:GSA25T00003101001.1